MKDPASHVDLHYAHASHHFCMRTTWWRKALQPFNVHTQQPHAPGTAHGVCLCVSPSHPCIATITVDSTGIRLKHRAASPLVQMAHEIRVGATILWLLLSMHSSALSTHTLVRAWQRNSTSHVPHHTSTCWDMLSSNRRCSLRQQSVNPAAWQCTSCLGNTT